MANFNTANDLASQLLMGRGYQSGQLSRWPTRILFTHREKRHGCRGLGFFDEVVLHYIQWMNGEFGYEPSREPSSVRSSGCPAICFDKALLALANRSLVAKTEKGYAPKS